MTSKVRMHEAVEAFLDAESHSQSEPAFKRVTKSAVAAKLNINYRSLCRKIKAKADIQ